MKLIITGKDGQKSIYPDLDEIELSTTFSGNVLLRYTGNYSGEHQSLSKDKIEKIEVEL